MTHNPTHHRLLSSPSNSEQGFIKMHLKLYFSLTYLHQLIIHFNCTSNCKSVLWKPKEITCFWHIKTPITIDSQMSNYCQILNSVFSFGNVTFYFFIVWFTFIQYIPWASYCYRDSSQNASEWLMTKTAVN